MIGQWQRLDRRTLAVHLKWLGPPIGSVALYALFTGGDFNRDALIRLGVLTCCFLLVSCFEAVQLLTTGYRVTEELFELRKGLLLRQHKSIRLERIRRVDLTANPIHRVLGIAVVRIGTGEHHSHGAQELKLASLSRAAGQQLREELLQRANSAATEPEQAPEDGVLAKLDWAWIRYAPLTAWGVLSIVIIVGALTRVVDWFGVHIDVLLDAVIRFFGTASTTEVFVTLGLVTLVLGVLSSLVAFVEEWWNYRLERPNKHTYRVRRGLLTTRQVAIDRRRMRGVEVRQPLLMRLAGAARVEAIATGLTGGHEEHTKIHVLTPAIPKPEADRIAAAVAEQFPSPTASTRLTGHPKPALRRRFVRAAWVVLGVLGLLVLGGLTVSPNLLTAAWITAIPLVPICAALAMDAYRALGHGLTGAYLVTRYGAITRSTVAVRTDGVIGWRVVRSPTQRLSGLATVSAITSAGKRGCYKVRDVGVSEGLSFADEAVPGLLAPFLRRRSTPTATPVGTEEDVTTRNILDRAQ
ncbi:PH domain-containing protein [Kutzneria albida]|uniref:YdbS-like PH domain-containing protein n=1 Tax=Kutzneria albida DSM 43870 TaxID=1449976 RepID=W5W5X9_9PSEU|nr:PH domain-containing protein [Kutzneria albida]AHH95901.1 hypothetical protein KALB_2533 [Kutzneria albida DSM 43870]